MKKLTCFALAAIMLCAMFCFTGCREKEPVTADEFRAVVQSCGYEVMVSDHLAGDSDDVRHIYIAKVGDNPGYHLEFYEMATIDAAQKLYDGNRRYFEQYEYLGVHKSISLENYSNYTLTSKSNFGVLSLIDNTMIYAEVPMEYKDQIIYLLYRLGY